MRELENLKEAGSRGAGLRILRGKHTGSSYTSDLSAAGIEHLVKSAVELADITTEDPHAGLPDPEELGSIPGDLGLYSPDVAGLETGVKVESAREAEEAALSADPRIFNSEGASFDSHVGRHVFANSRGFAGEYRTSYCSLSAVPVARDGESMERDYWYTMARDFRGLEPAGDVGRKAAARALRRLNPVKVPTQKVPVIFDQSTARSLLDNIFDAVHGMAIYRHESFLAGKLGEKVANDNLTVIDDGTIPGLFGTSPIRRRGRSFAPYGGDRARRAEELPVEHLCRAETRAEDHRQRFARTDRQCRNRARELFHRKGRPIAGTADRGRDERLLCDGADGLRRQHRNRRLFARSGRFVDSRMAS